MGRKEKDFVQHLFVSTTHHYFLFFTNKGKVYRLKVHEIPEASRQAKGTAIVNLLNLESNEYVTTVIPIKEFEPTNFLLMATRQGIIKKTPLDKYNTSRRDGIIALLLDDHDELVNVVLTEGDEDAILCTLLGKAIRFPETDVRSMGRVSRGVKGISLREGDQVVSMTVVKDDADLLVVTAQGYGKRTALTEYRSQIRGGVGIINVRVNERNGNVVSALVIKPHEEIMMISAEGVMIRLRAGDMPSIGRVTQGVTMMKLGPGDYVVAVARLAGED
jgi:DNA gyrase subunit A